MKYLTLFKRTELFYKHATKKTLAYLLNGKIYFPYFLIIFMNGI